MVVNAVTKCTGVVYFMSHVKTQSQFLNLEPIHWPICCSLIGGILGNSNEDIEMVTQSTEGGFYFRNRNFHQWERKHVWFHRSHVCLDMITITTRLRLLHWDHTQVITTRNMFHCDEYINRTRHSVAVIRIRYLGKFIGSLFDKPMKSVAIGLSVWSSCFFSSHSGPEPSYGMLNSLSD